ncbi:MAG: tetratricopeptide repeat protein [Clostridia bacterium]|nr:tetratricopeptide repeat protein [Clostridia bacterium]
MSKNKAIKIIISTILIALIFVSVIFYVADIVMNDTSPTKNLFALFALIITGIVGLARLFFAKGNGRGLDFYEQQYSEILKEAFSDSLLRRKKLLCAIRLYNENKYKKAVKYLNELQPLCKKYDDFYSVGIFLGLIFTDAGLKEDAVDIYQTLISMNVTSATIYSNLGSLHSSLGNYDEAIANFRLSVQNDEKNHFAYNNLAKLYFDTFDFVNAKKYALKALEINHKMRQAANLLAILFSLENDSENAQKYFHIAIAAGEAPEDLKHAIEFYKSSYDINKESTDED